MKVRSAKSKKINGEVCYSLRYAMQDNFIEASAASVYTWVQKGKVSGYKINNVLYLPQNSIDYINANLQRRCRNKRFIKEPQEPQEPQELNLFNHDSEDVRMQKLEAILMEMQNIKTTLEVLIEEFQSIIYE